MRCTPSSLRCRARSRISNDGRRKYGRIRVTESSHFRSTSLGQACGSGANRRPSTVNVERFYRFTRRIRGRRVLWALSIRRSDYGGLRSRRVRNFHRRLFSSSRSPTLPKAIRSPNSWWNLWKRLSRRGKPAVFRTRSRGKSRPLKAICISRRTAQESYGERHPALRDNRRETWIHRLPRPRSCRRGRRGLAASGTRVAIFFCLYGVIERDDVRYVCSTFLIVQR